jgi:hypothetical protein
VGDGVDVRQYEYKALATDVLAVAVTGEVNDWAAYIGAVPGENHMREYELVGKTGTKLPYELARILFPEFDAEYSWRK